MISPSCLKQFTLIEETQSLSLHHNFRHFFNQKIYQSLNEQLATEHNEIANYVSFIGEVYIVEFASLNLNIFETKFQHLNIWCFCWTNQQQNCCICFTLKHYNQTKTWTFKLSIQNLYWSRPPNSKQFYGLWFKQKTIRLCWILPIMNPLPIVTSKDIRLNEYL